MTHHLPIIVVILIVVAVVLFARSRNRVVSQPFPDRPRVTTAAITSRRVDASFDERVDDAIELGDEADAYEASRVVHGIVRVSVVSGEESRGIVHHPATGRRPDHNLPRAIARASSDVPAAMRSIPGTARSVDGRGAPFGTEHRGPLAARVARPPLAPRKPLSPLPPRPPLHPLSPTP